MAEQAAAVQSQANDLAANVVGALDAGDLDPGELDAINARLDQLDRLKRKYGGIVERVLEYGGRRSSDRRRLRGRDERAAELAAKSAPPNASLRPPPQR